MAFFVIQDDLNISLSLQWAGCIFAHAGFCLKTVFITMVTFSFWSSWQYPLWLKNSVLGTLFTLKLRLRFSRDMTTLVRLTEDSVEIRFLHRSSSSYHIQCIINAKILTSKSRHRDITKWKDATTQIPPEIISVDEALLLRFKSDDTINSKVTRGIIRQKTFTFLILSLLSSISIFSSLPYCMPLLLSWLYFLLHKLLSLCT